MIIDTARSHLQSIVVGALVLLLSSGAWAQTMEGEQEEPEKTPKEAAPVDMTGYWVSMVVEDWHWRMVTPPKGNYASMRRVLNEEGNRVADTWDPERDANTCKHFGAAGMIRNPMRIKLSWVDDYTLQLETDHGEQKRVFRFDGSSHQPDVEPSLQGDSRASWDLSGLKVVTTNLVPGYLRKNGVPYSGETLLTEYFDTYQAFDDDWLTVKTIVQDPIYLSDQFLTSTDFKKLPDGSSWHPVSCGTSSGPQP